MICDGCKEPLDGDEVLVPRFPQGVYRFHGQRPKCRGQAVRRAASSFPGCSGQRGSRVAR